MKRYSFYLSESVMLDVQIMAVEQQRPVSFIVSTLLAAAIKEKNRKKKKPTHSSASENKK